KEVLCLFAVAGPRASLQRPVTSACHLQEPIPRGQDLGGARGRDVLCLVWPSLVRGSKVSIDGARLRVDGRRRAEARVSLGVAEAEARLNGAERVGAVAALKGPLPIDLLYFPPTRRRHTRR